MKSFVYEILSSCLKAFNNLEALNDWLIYVNMIFLIVLTFFTTIHYTNIFYTTYKKAKTLITESDERVDLGQ